MSTKSLKDLKIKLFADGADKASMLELNDNPYISGMTTNPSLMKKAGISDYLSFAQEILKSIKTKPVSFEVFADDIAEMKRQALIIKEWQDNVYVKIPIINTKGESCLPLIKELSHLGTKLNITALFDLERVKGVREALDPNVPAVVSVFAGRLADSGIDPMPLVKDCAKLLVDRPKAELLWASTREVFNIYQAEECGCKIITAPKDVLDKAIKMVGTTPEELTFDTVKTFLKDSTAAGFKL
jgi:transaldolase